MKATKKTSNKFLKIKKYEIIFSILLIIISSFIMDFNEDLGTGGIVLGLLILFCAPSITKNIIENDKNKKNSISDITNLEIKESKNIQNDITKTEDVLKTTKVNMENIKNLF